MAASEVILGYHIGHMVYGIIMILVSIMIRLTAALPLIFIIAATELLGWIYYGITYASFMDIMWYSRVIMGYVYPTADVVSGYHIWVMVYGIIMVLVFVMVRLTAAFPLISIIAATGSLRSLYHGITYISLIYYMVPESRICVGVIRKL